MKITMGIFGFGGMAYTHHYKWIVEKIPEIAIKGAFDIDPEREQVIKECGLKVYLTSESLLADEEIDLVLITMPNHFHKDYAIRSLRAGKHVLCEKPCMLCSEDLEEVLAVAKETGKIFTVYQNRRWDRDYLIVKRILDSKEIGKPFFIESRVNGKHGIPAGWRCFKEAGGGMLYDWGVHLIDQVLQIFDCPITELYCQMFHLKYEEVDDNFKLFMKFENGVCVTIEVGTFHLIAAPRWLIHCDEGSLKIESGSSGADIVKKSRMESGTEEYHIDIEDERKNYIIYQMLVDAIKTGDYSKVAVKPDEVRRSTKVIEAAFRSARDGILIKENI